MNEPKVDNKWKIVMNKIKTKLQMISLDIYMLKRKINSR